MFSAQAVARADENRAKEIAGTIGRIGIACLTKGASMGASVAKDTAIGVSKAVARKQGLIGRRNLECALTGGKIF